MLLFQSGAEKHACSPRLYLLKISKSFHSPSQNFHPTLSTETTAQPPILLSSSEFSARVTRRLVQTVGSAQYTKY